jgi:hypothetical protein
MALKTISIYPVTRLASLLAIALCLAVTAGCSLLRVGYGQLDMFAEWTADEYFELGPQQKDEFRARFSRLHTWHRYEQLPDYAGFLDAAATRVRRGLSQEDAMWLANGVEERYRVLVRRSADDAAALLMTVTPAQLEALQRKWNKENARFAREHRVRGSAEEQHRARVERELKRIEEWAGSLSAEQERKVAALVKEVPIAPRLRYEDRVRRQREFIELMGERRDRREFASRLRHFLLNWEEGRDPEFQKVFADWKPKQAGFYREVIAMLTPEQRETVLRRMQRYSADFTQLAQRDGSGTGSSKQRGCPGCPRAETR